MVYVAADGTVGGRKSIWMQVRDFFATLFQVIALFFTTITNPKAVERRTASRGQNRTFAQRNGGRSYRADGSSSGTTRRGGRGSNIKGLDHLGDAKCAVGGG